MTFWRLAAAALPLLLVDDTVHRMRPEVDRVELSAVANLGRKIFFDASLSASGKMSCATCHSPEHAYGPPNALAVQPGGSDLRSAGLRAVPSLRYHEFAPSFSIGPTDATPDNDDVPPPPVPQSGERLLVPKGSAGGAAPPDTPMGGLGWDGRADTFQDQALTPFLDPNEMAIRDKAELFEKLRRAPYAEDFRILFGKYIFEQPDLALNEALFAVGRFQNEDPGFHPYDSRYDRFLAGKERLTPQEKRGLELFEDPKKGNCSSCHISKPSRDGRFPAAFTDFEFVALGAPRNPAIPANRDPAFFDLGLCGPLRKEFAAVPAYCGLFKTPTLRNVAVRGVFFHNGAFHSLEDVVKFYVERETFPDRWFPRKPDGTVEKYNDLPPRYRKNVDTVDAPFDRKSGDPPALSAAEIADIVAFMKTLTDRDLE